VRGLGVVENCVNVGPLTLRSTLRLFARLSPSMVTAQSKADFVNALLPLKQIHVTVDSRELTTVSSEILSIFGNGHPSKIISLACSSTEETVSSLRSAGERIASTDGLAVRIQDLPAV
jgi:DNA-binding NarL/FixJ family response regulator